jgi:thymidylate synthase (FAD)
MTFEKGRVMNVEVISATSKPIHLLSFAAGICYGKADQFSEKRVRNCIKMGHTSIVEHAVVSYHIDGISRSCLAQLCRHRHISLSVQSQRYCKFDEKTLKDGNWYVTPPSVKVDSKTLEEYCDDMDCQLKKYINLTKIGVKSEDARFLLPESTKTRLVMSTNARELQSILKLRLDSHAQWEIRELAQNMYDRAHDIDDEWATLVEWLLEF